MKKTLIIIVILLALCLVLVSCNGKTDDTKQVKIIEIRTVQDLLSISNFLGDKYSLYEFVLMNDLDLSEEDWIPIGIDSENSFTATFDGNGNTIHNLTIKGYDIANEEFIREIPNEYIGLFGYIANATIKNLNLQDVNISFISSYDYIHIGGLVGYAFGNNTIKNIKINGFVGVGTTYHLVKKNIFVTTCNQVQYIGGVFGYASGVIDMDSVNVEATIDNFIATRGPKTGYGEDGEDVVLYENDKKGRATNIPLMEINNDLSDRYLFFPDQSFAGCIGGYSRGNSSHFQNINGASNIDNFYSKSAYLGGLFGAIYNATVTKASYSGQLQMSIYTKGVLGGISALADRTDINESFVEDSNISLGIYRTKCESYTIGGLLGYANDYSTIQNCQVIDTKILSDYPNKSGINDEMLNYPIIGGLVGTIRDSAVINCYAKGGGVFKTSLDNNGENENIDNFYLFTAGMVADVYGNSTIKLCKSSFNAYSGTVARCSDTIYVDENGNSVIRFAKVGLPEVYFGANAYVEKGILIVDIIDEAQKIVATYKYSQFVGEDIEQFSQNYYDASKKCLIDANGEVIQFENISMTDFEKLTGKCDFEELYYYSESVLNNGNGEDIGDGWYKLD